MKLSQLFNFEKTTLKTTATPEGLIHETRYSASAFDPAIRSWTSRDNPLLLEMRANEFGSYDLGGRVKLGVFKWSWTALKTNLRKQEAINLMVAQEAEVMRKYGGFSQGVTTDDVVKKVKEGDYGRSHIFGYLKKNPEALDAWLASVTPAPQLAAAQPAVTPQP